MIIQCSASDIHGRLNGCKNPVTRKCICRKCINEDPMYACQEHVLEVGAKHLRIYDRTVDWILIPVTQTTHEIKFRAPANAVYIDESPEQNVVEEKDDWSGAKQW